MKGTDKNSLIWAIFMTSSMHAAIFLGKGYSENLHSIRNTGRKPTVLRLFNVTQTLIHEQEVEISGVSELSWSNSKREKLHLASDEEVIQLMKAKVYVFSNFVLCVGKMREYPRSKTDWENRLSWFKSTPQYRELDGIDGELVELEWRMFPGHTTLQILQEIHTLMGERNYTPEKNPKEHENELTCLENSTTVSCFARRFALERWSFLGSGSETKWNATDIIKPGGEWDRVAKLMMDNFSSDGHRTEKSRIPDEEENDSARTGQPSSQELRIEPHSQKETDKPSAKAKFQPNSSSIQQPFSGTNSDP